MNLKAASGHSIYQETRVFTLAGGAGAGQTGRRTGTIWAAMKPVAILHGGSAAGGSATSKVCEDISFAPDKCTSTKRGTL